MFHVVNFPFICLMFSCLIWKEVEVICLSDVLKEKMKAELVSVPNAPFAHFGGNARSRLCFLYGMFG